MTRIALLALCFVVLNKAISQDINLYFDNNSDIIRYKDVGKLDEIISQYKQRASRITLRGYADSTGSDGYNLDLSKRRALSVKYYLLNAGVREKDLSIEFYGEKGASGAEQFLNRRVGIFVESSEKKTFSDYSHFIESISPAKEIFEISSDVEGSFEGKKGTLIKIPPGAFRYSNGQPVRGPVTIEVTEYSSNADLISKRLSTIAGGNLLVTSGAINITASKNGIAVDLRDSTEVTLSFPRTTSDRFYTFCGGRLADSSMDWNLDEDLWSRQPSSIGVTVSDDGRSLVVVDKQVADKKNKQTIFDRQRQTFREATRGDWEDINDEHKADSIVGLRQDQNYQNLQRYYNTISSRRLNWVNCDFFLRDSSSEIITYNVRATNSGIHVFASFLVFDKIRSVIEMSRRGDGNYGTYARLPLRQPVHLLVVGTVAGKFVVYFDRVELQNQKTENVELKESTFDEFATLLKQI